MRAGMAAIMSGIGGGLSWTYFPSAITVSNVPQGGCPFAWGGTDNRLKMLLFRNR